jgi:hypothetical protein
MQHSDETEGEFKHDPVIVDEAKVLEWMQQVDLRTLERAEALYKRVIEFDPINIRAEVRGQVTEWRWIAVPFDGACGPSSLAALLWTSQDMPQGRSKAVRCACVSTVVRKWSRYKEDRRDGPEAIQTYLFRMMKHDTWFDMDTEMRAAGETWGMGVAVLCCDRPDERDAYWKYIPDTHERANGYKPWCIILWSGTHFEPLMCTTSERKDCYWFTWNALRSWRYLNVKMRDTITDWRLDLRRRSQG